MHALLSVARRCQTVRFLFGAFRWLMLLVVACVLAGADWMQFRGNQGTGFAPGRDLPTQFSDTENVAWKVPLPGTGPSSPIVVAGRVLVTAATGPRQDRLHLLAFEAATGKLVWERQLWATGHTLCNPFGGVAGPTPASDGQHVFAFYSSNDLACFDLDGNLKWLRGLAYERPLTRNDVGMASSPVVVGDTVVVQMENQGCSWATGIDAATGQTRWCIERDREATWTTPVVLRGPSPEKDLVLLQSRSRISAHEPRSGKQVWSWEENCSTISSAVVDGDRVYVPSGGLTAFRFDPARRTAQRLWQEPRLAPVNASPVVHGGAVYVIRSPSILVCADASTGAVRWQLRLRGPIWATPVLVEDHLYAVSHGGLVQVVRLGSEGQDGKLVGTGQLDEGILATPAVADEAIYFRSNRHLWKIAKTAKR